jgi:hypothetical protein
MVAYRPMQSQSHAVPDGDGLLGSLLGEQESGQHSRARILQRFHLAMGARSAPNQQLDRGHEEASKHSHDTTIGSVRRQTMVNTIEWVAARPAYLLRCAPRRSLA